jgi:hypothetical protein
LLGTKVLIDALLREAIAKTMVADLNKASRAVNFNHFGFASTMLLSCAPAMTVCPDDAEFYSECWQAIKHCPLGIEARLFSQYAKHGIALRA